jgi:hypothetical protein
MLIAIAHQSVRNPKPARPVLPERAAPSHVIAGDD